MGLVIDHLSADHRVRVLRAFRDARGRAIEAGETAIIRRMDLDWAAQEIVVEWERAGGRESLYFGLQSRTGPGNGRMREFFALEERVDSPEDVARREQRKAAPPVPDVEEALVTEPARYADAVRRTWALAARRRFEEAEAQIAAILTPPDPFGGRLEQLAGDLVQVARAHAEQSDPTVYQWARERALHLWYAWGSQATSGGEGECRAQSIREAEGVLAECDARRR